jgi:hypothetical protein
MKTTRHFVHISLISSYNDKLHSCRGKQDTHFVFYILYSKIVPFMR